jgi:membrane protease subunit HflK
MQRQIDFEELLKAQQRKPGQTMPGSSGMPGSVAFIAAIILAAVVAYFGFTFRVYPDELGVVMRFGKITRQEPAGLHFRMPYPIDEVRLPKVTRQNIIEIGMATRGGSSSMREGA